MKRYLDHSPETVALIGMGPSIADLFTETLTQEFMPDFADEFWTINMASNMVHSDVVFWMDDLRQQERFKPGLLAVLRRRGVPVITSRADTVILPNSYDYPIDEIVALALPIFGKPYLNNGVAEAIAYALWKGVKILKVYGADFSYPNRDYAESGRACVEAWVTVACMRQPTMEVRLCPKTSLFDSVIDKGIYGYATQPTITLPDGQKYQYKSPGEITAAYVAEDSSGQETKDESDVLGDVPGTESPGTNSDRTDTHAGNGVDSAPPAAAARSGKSLRGRGKARRNKKRDPAGADSR